MIDRQVANCHCIFWVTEMLVTCSRVSVCAVVGMPSSITLQYYRVYLPLATTLVGRFYYSVTTTIQNLLCYVSGGVVICATAGFR